MPRACTVCKHKEKQEIEASILTSVSIRKIADKYKLSTGAVSRHKKKCITDSLQVLKKIQKLQRETKEEDEEALIDKQREKDLDPEMLSGVGIIKNLNKLTANLDNLRRKAEGSAQYTAAISAVKEQIRLTENLLKRAEELMRFESEQKKDNSIDFKENLPSEIDQLLNTLLNDPDLEPDEIEGEYLIVSEN